MNKQFVAVIAVVIIGLFGVFALTKKSNEQSTSNSSNGTSVSEHKKGAGTKNVTLIEYGDFQCPACKSYYPIVKQIAAAYGDEITIQFRHFPLTQIHPSAFAASRAAEAAGKQNKFFEMHDLLYENQDSWTSIPNASAVFETYAQQLGLNMDQYKADVASGQTAEVINADIKAGQAIGANSTPTFVLNGKKIDNPKTFEEFKTAIDAEIAKQGN